jgi:hypothetical protein
VSYGQDQNGGVDEDGCISNEKYDDAIHKVAELNASLVASAEGDEENIRLWSGGGCSEIARRLLDMIYRGPWSGP